MQAIAWCLTINSFLFQRYYSTVQAFKHLLWEYSVSVSDLKEYFGGKDGFEFSYIFLNNVRIDSSFQQPDDESGQVSWVSRQFSPLKIKDLH